MKQSQFDQWILRREEEGSGISDASRKVYGAMWRSLCRELSGSESPGVVEIESALERLKLSPTSRRRYLQLLAKVLGQESAAAAVLEQAAIPEKPAPATLSPVRENNLSAALESFDPRDRALTLLYLGAGLRTGESVRLRREDLHLDEAVPWILVRNAFDTVVRSAPLNAAAAQALREWARSHDDPFVFPGKDDGPLDVSSAWKICKRATQAVLGNKSAESPRRMRHAFAIRQLAAGESLSTVGAWIGHRQVSSTARLEPLVPHTRQPV
ncbi:MAG TPA: site-specific integrase [Rhodocyclaceae bacterium]|jgi:integrase|nr:site-specific integrase [Rhodocyclaceae bacterium]